MKFYSYDYVLSQISQQNGIMIGFGIVLLAITGFFAFKGSKETWRGLIYRCICCLS